MSQLPRHVAIIMDGNGRWAAKRHLPRQAGHRQGLQSARNTVEHAAKTGVEVLTLFAFGQENWKRPEKEVSFLMSLFIESLKKEVHQLAQNQVCLKVIGDRSGLAPELIDAIETVEDQLKDQPGVKVNVAFNYSGRWDILQAVNRLREEKSSEAPVNEALFATYLSTHDLPEPDILIRTSGEQRLSNFMLWQCAYTECFFIEKTWPEFNNDDFDEVLDAYEKRQRRFGKTGEQLDCEAIPRGLPRGF